MVTRNNGPLLGFSHSGLAFLAPIIYCGSLASLSVMVATGWTLSAGAQITPDGTLGNERSVINPNATIHGLPGVLIEGGATRGNNLFQSFINFNVGNGQRVYFANPAGIDNILGRVTGLNPSNILGTLGVDGAANLFLINPNGILFGPNARLDIRGSFVGSTASSLDFGNGLAFSAVNPAAPPLLTVALRPGVQYGTNYRGNISNTGDLAVGAGQTLVLAGNAVTNAGSLTAPGGTVQVLGDRVSLIDQSQINVAGVGGGGMVLVGGDWQGKGAVPNATQTFIGANATINADAIGNGNGGKVIVWANQNTDFHGNISAKGGQNSGNGGLVEVSGKQTLSFNGRVNTFAAQGKSGTLLLDPFDLVIDAAAALAINVSTIQEVLLAADNNITFNAPINISNSGTGLSATAGSNIFVNQNITTNGGGVALRAENGGIFVRGGANKTRIETTATGDSISNFIVLNAKTQVEVVNAELVSRNESNSSFQYGGDNRGAIGILAREGSVLLDNVYLSTTSTGKGDAGLIFMTASDKIEILNSIDANRDFTQSPGLFSQGNGGGILIGNDSSLADFPTPKTIRISNSNLSVNNRSASLTQANSGNIYLGASESVILDNGTRVSTSAGLGIDGAAGIPGNAGNVSVSVQENGSITLLNESFISSSTYGQGNAGQIFLKANSGTVSLGGDSTIFNNIEQGGQGQSGGIKIETGSLLLKEGSQIQTIVRGNADDSSKPGGIGNGGVIFVQASDSVRLVGFAPTEGGILPSGLRSSVGQGAQGDSGIVFVQTPLLYLNDKAAISTSNRSEAGLAGYILAEADFIILDRGAGLFAISTSGKGGNIGLQTPYLVGVSRDSVISTVVGTQGTPGLGGNVVIGANLTLDDANQVRFDSKAPTLLVYGFPSNDSDLLANAFAGKGGRIDISALTLRNLVVRKNTPIRDDIDATGGAGGLDGVVTVSTLNLDPDRGLTPLADRFRDPRLGEGCDPRTRREDSKFLLSSRGGAISDPSRVLTPPIPSIAATLRLAPSNRDLSSRTRDVARWLSTPPAPPSQTPAQTSAIATCSLP